MKDFDLQAALSGEPVVLRDGRKAVVLLDYRETIGKYGIDYDGEYPLRGFVVSSHGTFLSWGKEGFYDVDNPNEHKADIVGMWEEPAPTITIGDMEVPAPMTEKPEVGAAFWTMDIGFPCDDSRNVDKFIWTDGDVDNQFFNAGWVFKTQADAEKAHAALRALMAKQFEKVKGQKK